MAQFKSLAAIQAHLEKDVHLIVNRSAELERILADAMVDSAMKNVYDVYEPETYNRRESEGGLADSRNYEISSVTIEAGRVKLVFENLTQGNDNLSHTFLTDTIEEGIQSSWDREGVWSQPRPFVAEAMRSLKENPEGILNAIRSGLISKGFTVR